MSHTVNLNLLPFDIAYVFSARRSISLEVKGGQVVMRAPKGATHQELESFAFSKCAWVLAKMAEQKKLLEEVPSYDFKTGTLLPLLGKQLRLEVAFGTRAMVQRQEENLFVLVSSRSKLPVAAQVKKLVEGWYRNEALSLLTQKTYDLCSQQALTCRSVTVRDTRTKWGHCTAQGHIQYNWKIILAPMSVVDYLVVHEVCHLKHHNHSRTYWKYIEQVYPQFESERRWLRDEGFRLVLDEKIDK